ncbi:MAG: DUF4340 domain-containing protein [Verrucomicrobiota bacterium]
MNRKQFLLLTLAVVLAGLAGWTVHRRQGAAWLSAGPAFGQKLFPNFPVNDIDRITLRSATNELVLFRRDGAWRVRERADYPADFAQVSSLLLKCADLKAAQTEDAAGPLLGRFELLPPASGTNAGLRIEFANSHGPVGSLLLGKMHLAKATGASQFGGSEGWPDGRYILVGDAPPVVVVREPLENVVTKPEAWLDKNFFSIEKPVSISVQFETATNSWKLTRASITNDWQLDAAAPGEKPDPAKVSALSSPFRSPNLSDVLPPGTEAGSAGLTNVILVTVQTSDGLTYSIRIGSRQGADYPLQFTVSGQPPAARTPEPGESADDKKRRDDEFAKNREALVEKLSREQSRQAWIYQVPSWLVEPLLVTRQQLVGEDRKPETNEPAAP